MAKMPNRRRILVIEPGLQFRYLVLPLIVAVTMSACLFALFLAQGESLKGMASGDPGLQKEVGKAQGLVAAAVVAVLLGHVGLIVWIGLRASHKLAGPVYKFKKTVQEILDGDRSARVRLREKDQLGELAGLFNRMMDRLEGREPPEDAAESPAGPE